MSAAPQPAVATGSAQSGMILMIAATLIVPAGDAMSKYLSAYMMPVEITLYRYGLQAVVLAIAMLALRKSFAPRKPLLLFLGGVLSAATLITLIGAFAVMPIATAMSIFFVEPLILTVLSVLLLGEKAGPHRYVAIAIGLIGAIVIIRPNWASFGWPAIFPLFAATFFSLIAIIIRKLSPVLSGLAIQFWFSVFGSLVVGIGLGLATMLGLFRFEIGDLGPLQLSIVPMQALLSAATFLMFTEAFRRTEASILAPFQYIEIIGATVIGYLVFGDFPDAITWLGAAIILSSGIYVFSRERRQSMKANEMARPD